jgi:hypothetical protein
MYNNYFVISLLALFSITSALKMNKKYWAENPLENVYKSYPFTIVSKLNGKSIHVLGESKDNNAAIAMWSYNGASHFKWKVENCKGMYCHIRNIATGKCLHVPGATNNNYAELTQWECINQPNLRWRISQINPSVYTFINEATSKCLFTPNNNVDGVKVQQASCTIWEEGQLWYINLV